MDSSGSSHMTGAEQPAEEPDPPQWFLSGWAASECRAAGGEPV